MFSLVIGGSGGGLNEPVTGGVSSAPVRLAEGDKGCVAIGSLGVVVDGLKRGTGNCVNGSID